MRYEDYIQASVQHAGSHRTLSRWAVENPEAAMARLDALLDFGRTMTEGRAALFAGLITPKEFRLLTKAAEAKHQADILSPLCTGEFAP